ncbi:hypothetical protein HRI_002259200 [Hibiscus trionum]|uniref:Reverse transcriptase domain-containing protein n=1 Tax=Hibiscus trionum TaxID=183268 RepID=A0A9W7HYC4_HIBTR|nr:hypothetical protein HRI_002259200 [Hibiscus trionum]
MRGFRNVLEDCGLFDLGYYGPWFTWEKGRLEATLIRERLDRGVANDGWWNLFPNVSVCHLTHSFSDHCPLMLTTGGGDAESNRTWHFRFEAAWLLEESCEPEVRKLWDSSSGDVPDRLKFVSSGLNFWFKKIRKEKKLTVQHLEERIEKLNELQPTDEVLGELLDSKLQMNLELDKKELYWEQRARANWLRNGDQNTNFFHRYASERKRKDKISRIKNDADEWVDDLRDLHGIARDYFQNLFTSQGSFDADYIFQNVGHYITPDLNSMLTVDYCKDEVWLAIKEMSPLKASGEDGLGAVFYQKFWHIVGDDVSSFCLSALRGEIPLQSINRTHIVLIPKTDAPTRLAQYRPISLCNVLFKIISKVIANRFQKALSVCIDTAQSAFVPNRLITDNIIVAYETLHYLRNKRVGKQGEFALKLDMNKAYDRVEWVFIEGMLLKMGFDDQWVSRILQCISTVSYSVVINGEVGPVFFPTRGLRQEDPLSPYLFLICSEGLSSLLRNAATYGSLRGIRINRYAPRITHLLFADDSLLFGDATAKGARRIKSILDSYARSSGQLINFDKSGIFFGSNVVEENKEDVCRVLGVSMTTNPEKYLGLPTFVGRDKKKAFADLRGRFLKCSKNWNSCKLSQGGKSIFIRSVLQALPLFAMCCFLFPKSICQELESIMARFCWQRSVERRGIHWCKWKDLSVPKDVGGLGFRDLAKFNIALLAKQGWRLLQDPSSLLARVLKAKYFPTTTFLNASLGSAPSQIWRSLWSAKGLLQMGLKWRVGSGHSINIWNDYWLPGKELRKIESPPHRLYCRVSQLLNEAKDGWDTNILSQLFTEDEASSILEIQIPISGRGDLVVWGLENTGIYSVSSGYKALINLSIHNASAHIVFKSIWQANLPEKVKIQVWRFVMNYVPTKENLYTKRIATDPYCQNCLFVIEDNIHVVRDCGLAISCWHALNFSWPLQYNAVSFYDWFEWIVNNNSKQRVTQALVLIWTLWTARNKQYHEGIKQNTHDVVTFVRSYCAEWVIANTCLRELPQTQPQPWMAPPHSLMKVNVDASFRSLERRATTAVVIRNYEGQVIGAARREIQAIPSAFTAEARAVLHGISFAMDIGCTSVQVESDSLTVIKNLKSKDIDRSEIGAITWDIKSEARRLRFCEFLFTPRSGNRAAHALASEYKSEVAEEYWLEEVPYEVRSAVDMDRRWSDPP